MGDVRIATTTSVDNSFLSDALKTAFEYWQNAVYGSIKYNLDWNSLGSGAAMDAARNGLADIVLAHDRVGEYIFLSERYSFQREVVFWNYFILVGPSSSAVNWSNLQAGFTYIMGQSASPKIFLSRGKTGLSGTYVRELQIWKMLNLNAQPDNVLNMDQIVPPPEDQAGMMGTLQYAAQQQLYTLTDIGTWYRFLNDFDPPSSAPLKALTPTPTLPIITDPWASNQYSLMPVNPAACGLTPDSINVAGAEAFLSWMLTNTGANNAKDTVNGYKPDGVNQGFAYNAEMWPNDKCIIKHILNNL